MILPTRQCSETSWIPLTQICWLEKSSTKFWVPKLRGHDGGAVEEVGREDPDPWDDPGEGEGG